MPSLVGSEMCIRDSNTDVSLHKLLHKLFSAMFLDCSRIKFGYYTDTTLPTAASRRTVKCSNPETTAFDSFVERPRSLHRPPQWSPLLLPNQGILYHVRVRRVSSFSSPVARGHGGRRALWMRRLLLRVVCLLGTLWCPRRSSRCQLLLHLGLRLVLPS